MPDLKTLRAKIDEAIRDEYAAAVIEIVKQLCDELVSSGHGAKLADVLDGFTRKKA